jgi:small subunit ribosomal protein S4|tara:strand:- start:3355 stop:4038 length:684 start_codon:yes stop_codon:yes gene_type:complete
MGDPKFARPKTQTPTHPWKQARIEEEHALKEKYGLKKVGGMREIWREKSALRRHRNQAMKLIGRVDTSEGHFAREKGDLLASLTRKGLLSDGSSLDNILQIDVELMLARRLQSQVYYKGLAPSMRAARNLIVHGHISIGDQKMTVPGYHVMREEEELLRYTSGSKYEDPTHPFREELEKLRATVDASEEEASEVGGPVQATGDFVEDIKAGEAAAPTVEDTIPGGDN